MRVALLILPLMLAACGAPDDAPDGVTASEARELNEAAEMLDVNSVSANAVEGEAE